MGPRVSITRKEILEAAIAILEEEGWARVSARSIAAKLGSSTMPIYSSMGSMEALQAEARSRALELLFERQLGTRHEIEALGMAIGYVLFARDRPRLFTFLFTGNGSPLRSKEAVAIDGKTGIGTSPAIQSLMSQFSTERGRNDLVFNAWVYTHGLAILLAGGIVTMGDEEIAMRLSGAGEAFYLAAMSKEGGQP